MGGPTDVGSFLCEGQAGLSLAAGGQRVGWRSAGRDNGSLPGCSTGCSPRVLYQVHNKRENGKRNDSISPQQTEKLQGRTVNAQGVKRRRRTRYTAKSSSQECASV